MALGPYTNWTVKKSFSTSFIVSFYHPVGHWTLSFRVHIQIHAHILTEAYTPTLVIWFIDEPIPPLCSRSMAAFISTLNSAHWLSIFSSRLFKTETLWIFISLVFSNLSNPSHRLPLINSNTLVFLQTFMSLRIFLSFFICSAIKLIRKKISVFSFSQESYLSNQDRLDIKPRTQFVRMCVYFHNATLPSWMIVLIFIRYF